MGRAVTAIYRTYEGAAQVRDELDRLGVERHRVKVLPDSPQTGVSGGGATAGAAGTGRAAPEADFTVTEPRYADTVPAYTDADADADASHQVALNELRRLNLPDADTRTYEQAIRNGDYVVSVEVGDDADTARIEEVMRRPGAVQDRVEGQRRPGRIITNNTSGPTVAALFESQSDAGLGVERLRLAGVPDRYVSVHPTASEAADLQAYGDQHERFHESIKDLPLAKEHTDTIVEAMTRGGYLVTVHDFDASLHDTVVAALEGRSTTNAQV